MRAVYLGESITQHYCHIWWAKRHTATYHFIPDISYNSELLTQRISKFFQLKNWHNINIFSINLCMIHYKYSYTLLYYYINFINIVYNNFSNFSTLPIRYKIVWHHWKSNIRSLRLYIFIFFRWLMSTLLLESQGVKFLDYRFFLQFTEDSFLQFSKSSN